ncbi:DUF2325 domain-containing protein [Fuchsiella alkaliacetigena]|uniref:DUF2325 domain-containing protein n=1 Tax=Fuchsiella alkaliacetigena TaxID=957042 RepID=UPI00200B29D6|nr:DUF2325 domain-containing protein [Fuchsiella alkaliacetigena]MCK8825981.1 DUF2325 domain-containing protein [Fuchsiella alkaliacetigena]
MSILVVGGDRLGNIPDKLSQIGAESIEHITGRRCKKCRINKGTDVVLVLTDYVNHPLSEEVKCRAKAKGIPVVFSRRSWACIYKKFEFIGLVS